MDFSKYQALGNDFVIVEGPSDDAVSPEIAIKLCDRHFGIGADGVLLLSPQDGAAGRMTVINADGSRPEMCGNGLRCVALFLHQRRQAPAQFRVATDAGLLDCEIQRRGDAPWVKLSLGRAKTLGDLQSSHADRTYNFHRISTGNPHAVTFDGIPSNEEIDRFAPTVSARLAGGANIEFVEQVGPDHLRVVVWERGVGRTLACGTGAGAVATAAAFAGLVGFDRPVAVDLPGGRLELTVMKETLEVFLAGPAVHVFDGQVVN